MAQPGVNRGKKALFPDAREPLNRVMCQDDQGTAKLRSKSVLTRKSTQVSDQASSSGRTRLAVQRPFPRNGRVLTPKASTKTSTADSGSQVSRPTRACSKAGVVCSRKVELPPRAAVVKGAKETADGVTGGYNRETKSCVGVVGTVNRRRAATPLGGTNQSGTKHLACEPEKKESRTKAPERTRRMPEVKTKVAGTKQEQRGGSQNCRAPRESRALSLTGGNHQETRKSAYAQAREREVATRAKVEAGTSASLARSAARTQTRSLSSNLTPPSTLEPTVGEPVHHRPARESIVCLQGSESSCSSASQHSSDLQLSAPTDDNDVSLAHGSTPTMHSNIVLSIAPPEDSAGGDATVPNVRDAHPSLENMLSPTKLSQNANDSVLPKGNWRACKPFPKRDAVVKSKFDARSCSPAAFGRGAAVPKTVLETKGVKPRVTCETDKVNGSIPPRRMVRVDKCTSVGGRVQEQKPSGVEVTKRATSNAKRGPLQEQKTAQIKGQSRMRDTSAFRPGARAATRTVNSSGSAKPAVPACATKNQALSRARPGSNLKTTALSGHILQAQPPQADPQQKNSLENGKPSQGFLRTKTESLTNPEKRPAAGCTQAQAGRYLKACARGNAAYGAPKRPDGDNEGKLPQGIQQREHVATLLKDSCSASTGQTKNVPSLKAEGSATLYRCCRLAIPGCRNGPNKPPVMVAKSMGGEVDARPRISRAGSLDVKLPKAHMASRLETSSKPEPVDRTEDLQSPSTQKKDQRTDPLQKNPSNKPVRRHPLVPPLPLHLLPEILARKDAEEAAFRRQHGYSIDERDEAEFELSVESGDRPTPLTHLHDIKDTYGLKPGPMGLMGRGDWQTVATQATSSSSGVPSLHLELHAGIGSHNGSSPREEEVYKISQDAASERAAMVIRGNLTGNSWIFSPLPRKEPSIAPQSLVQDKDSSEIPSGTEAATRIPSLECTQLRALILPQCRSYERGTDPKSSSKIDVHCGDLKQFIRCDRRGDAVLLSQVPEVELKNFSTGDAPLVDASLSRTQNSTFETRDPFHAGEVITPNNSLAVERSPELSMRSREPYTGPFRHVSTIDVGDGSNPRLHLPQEELPRVPEQDNAQSQRQVKALDTTLKADLQRQLHSNVRSTPANVSLEATQRKESVRLERVRRSKEACDKRSGPQPSALRRQAFSQTKPQPKHGALPTLRPPRLNSYSPTRATRAKTGDTAKQGARGSCSSHVGTSSLIKTQEHKPQRPTAQRLPEGGRSALQRKVQQPLKRRPRDVLTAGESIAGRDKQRNLLGQKQAANTALTLPMRGKESDNSPRTGRCMQKENVPQNSSCVRNAKVRSGSQKSQQCATSQSSVNACKRIPHDSGERPLNHGLNRPQSSFTQKPLTKKNNASPCAPRLLLRRENQRHGVHQGQDSKRPIRQAVRRTVLHSPLTVCGVEGEASELGDGSHQLHVLQQGQDFRCPAGGQTVRRAECEASELGDGAHLHALLQEEFSTVSAYGDEPDPSFVSLPKCATTAGQSTRHFFPELNLSTLERGGAPWEPLVTAAFAAPCALQRDSEKLLPDTDNPLRGRPCAVPEVPDHMNPRDSDSAVDAARCTSLRPSVNGRIDYGEFCPSGVLQPVERHRLPCRTNQRPADHQLGPSTDADIVDTLHQSGTSSEKVEMHNIHPSFSDATVDGSQQEHSVIYWNRPGQAAMTAQSCHLYPAARHPLTEKLHFQHLRPTSGRNDVAYGQSEVQYMSLTEQSTSRPTIPLDNNRPSVHCPTQQLLHVNATAPLRPPPSTARQSEKPVIDLMGNLTFEHDTFLPTAHRIQPQKDSQDLGLLLQSISQRSPRVRCRATPPRLWQEESHEVMPRVKAHFDTHVGVHPQQLSLHQETCHSGPLSAVSYSEIAPQLQPYHRALLQRLEPAAVICRH